jgi:hypothetical protein
LIVVGLNRIEQLAKSRSMIEDRRRRLAEQSRTSSSAARRCEAARLRLRR